MIFHLAIPTEDLKESETFYIGRGAILGRKYPTHTVMNLYGHQLVLHLSDEWDRDPKMYPRHFGLIINTQQDLENMWDHWKRADFVFQEYFVRHRGKKEEHHTFFLKDPSNNLIEFKWYKDKSSIF